VTVHVEHIVPAAQDAGPGYDPTEALARHVRMCS
jgi:hypothetical protein